MKKLQRENEGIGLKRLETNLWKMACDTNGDTESCNKEFVAFCSELIHTQVTAEIGRLPATKRRLQEFFVADDGVSEAPSEADDGVSEAPSESTLRAKELAWLKCTISLANDYRKYRGHQSAIEMADWGARLSRSNTELVGLQKELEKTESALNLSIRSDLERHGCDWIPSVIAWRA